MEKQEIENINTSLRQEDIEEIIGKHLKKLGMTNAGEQEIIDAIIEKATF